MKAHVKNYATIVTPLNWQYEMNEFILLQRPDEKIHVEYWG
jgi:hypothetical protein